MANIKRNAPGCKCGCNSVPSNACATYKVVILRNDNTTPVAGIAVTLNRYVGSWTTTTGGTLAPVAGTTGSDGTFTYSLPSSPPSIIQTCSIAIPEGGPSATFGFAKSGTTCTANARLCRLDTVTHYMDGDGGSLGDKTGRVYTLTGGTPSPTTYTLTYSDPLPDASAYWFGCTYPGNSGSCHTVTKDDHRNFWKRSKYNGAPGGTACSNVEANERKNYILKSLCVELERYVYPPGQDAVRDRNTSATIAWDPSSWNGDRTTNETTLTGNTRDAGGNIRMVYSGSGYTLSLYKYNFRNGQSGQAPSMELAIPPQAPFAPDYKPTDWGTGAYVGGTSVRVPSNGVGPQFTGGQSYSWVNYASDGPCGGIDPTPAPPSGGQSLSQGLPPSDDQILADTIAALPPAPPRDDSARIADPIILAEFCPHAAGPCGCGVGPPRQCGHPDHPAEVRRAYCLDCRGRAAWEAVMQIA